MVLAEEALGVDLVDVLRARRAGGEPAVARSTTFSPPIGAPLPGAVVRIAVIGSPASSVGRDLLGREPREDRLLRGRGRRVDAAVGRGAEALRQPAVDLAPGRGRCARSSRRRAGRR